MIVKRHRNQRQRRAKFGCHIDVGARRLSLSAGMIMDEDHRLGVMAQRGGDNLADIDRRLVDGAAGQAFLGDQPVPVVETQHHEMFDWFM